MRIYAVEESARMAEKLTKVCTKCGETKPLSEFYKHKGYALGVDSRCKVCAIAEQRRHDLNRVEDRREYARVYHNARRDEAIAGMRRYYVANKAKMNEQSRAYHAAHQAEVKAAGKRWREENREYIAKRSREAYANTPEIRIRQSIATSVRRALLGDKESKRTFEILGYTLEELMAHLEAQFLPGMSWENYEYRGWHIDHKRPQSSFRFTSISDHDFKECWSLSNLQPMWWRDNIVKGSRWEPFTPANDNDSEASGRAG
jgi:hypothetical protein